MLIVTTPKDLLSAPATLATLEMVFYVKVSFWPQNTKTLKFNSRSPIQTRSKEFLKCIFNHTLYKFDLISNGWFLPVICDISNHMYTSYLLSNLHLIEKWWFVPLIPHL